MAFIVPIKPDSSPILSTVITGVKFPIVTAANKNVSAILVNPAQPPVTQTWG